jgi:hypothetical protein
MQSIAVIVASVTALYYVSKFLLYVGRSVWSKLSPGFGRYIEKRLAGSNERTGFAVQDTGFLIAETGRKSVEIAFFTVAYLFVLITSEIDAPGEQGELSFLESFSRSVFAMAASYNLGRLWRWYGDVAKKKLEILRSHKQAR